MKFIASLFLIPLSVLVVSCEEEEVHEEIIIDLNPSAQILNSTDSATVSKVKVVYQSATSVVPVIGQTFVVSPQCLKDGVYEVADFEADKNENKAGTYFTDSNGEFQVYLKGGTYCISNALFPDLMTGKLEQLGLDPGNCVGDRRLVYINNQVMLPNSKVELLSPAFDNSCEI